jgi:hypothetical protein
MASWRFTGAAASGRPVSESLGEEVRNIYPQRLGTQPVVRFKSGNGLKDAVNGSTSEPAEHII